MNQKPKSGLILLDKPQGITSQGAVSRIRRLMNMKTVGHTGTLDPLATGLLPICFGRGTRASAYLTGSDKRYLAVLQMGEETDTGDSTGNVVARTNQKVTAAQVAAVLPFFEGFGQQIPPMYAAIKHQGQKLYQLARKGISVERQPRPITIHNLTLTEFDEEAQTFGLDVSCSKGTYIRVLCQDIARRLGGFGTMAALRRQETGRFSLAEGYTFETLEAMAAAQDYSFALPCHEIFADRPTLFVSEAGEARIRNGAAPKPEEILSRPPDGLVRIFGPGGFLAIGSIDEAGISVEKSFYEV